MKDSGNIYLTLGSLININNIVTNSKNINLRKVHAKLYGFDKKQKVKTQGLQRQI